MAAAVVLKTLRVGAKLRKQFCFDDGSQLGQ
jgi:hypothetical protein